MNENLFGKELRRLRLAAGLKLAPLAQAVGCSIPYICQVERGNKPPFSSEHITAFLKKIGCIDQLHILIQLANRARKVIEISLENKTAEQKDMLLLLQRKLESGDVDNDLVLKICKILGE